MYFYLYDSFVLDKKFESQLTGVEHKLIELGINGQTGKLTVLKNLEQMVDEAIKKGADTIVIIGDDKTFSRAIKTSAKENVNIGFIPFDSNSRYAKVLGIPSPEEAINILSKRIIKKIDIARINNSIYFLTSVEIKGTGLNIECDKKFKIVPSDKINHISICNFGNIIQTKEITKDIVCDPNDSLLEIMFFNQPEKKLFKNKNKKDSIIPAKKIFIDSKNEQISIVVDNETVAKTPATIEIAPKKIRLIVGKERMF